MKRVLIIGSSVFAIVFLVWLYANFVFKSDYTPLAIRISKQPLNSEAIMFLCQYYGTKGDKVTPRIQLYFPEIYDEILVREGQKEIERDALKAKEEKNERETLEGTDFSFDKRGVASRKLYGVDLIKVLKSHRFFNGRARNGVFTYPGIGFTDDGEFIFGFRSSDQYYTGNLMPSADGKFLYASTRAPYSYDRPEIEIYPVQYGEQPFRFKIVVENNGEKVIENTLSMHCLTTCKLCKIPEDEIETNEDRD